VVFGAYCNPGTRRTESFTDDLVVERVVLAHRPCVVGRFAHTHLLNPLTAMSAAADSGTWALREGTSTATTAHTSTATTAHVRSGVDKNDMVLALYTHPALNSPMIAF
jgi:hypothetical protein